MKFDVVENNERWASADCSTRLANETIIKRAEENHVHVIEDVNMVDKEKLKQLIEDSFGRPLAEGYLDNLNENLYPSTTQSTTQAPPSLIFLPLFFDKTRYRIYLITGMDGEYNGCAVIMRGVEWDASSQLLRPHNFHQDSDDDSSPNHNSYLHHNRHDSHDPHSDSDPHVTHRILENRRHDGLTRSEGPTHHHYHNDNDNDQHQPPHRPESPNHDNPNHSSHSNGTKKLKDSHDTSAFQIPTIELSDAARYVQNGWCGEVMVEMD